MNAAREVIVTSDSTGENYSAAVWDPTTASLLSTYKHASALGFHTLQLLGNSYLLAADAVKPTLHIWPLNSQNPIPNLHLSTPAKVTALASTPNGSYIVAALKEKMCVWQVSSGRLLATLAEHFQAVTCLTFTRDGAAFASGGEDGLIFIWSLSQVANGQCSPVHSFTVHSRAIKDLYFGSFGLKGRLCSASADCTAKIFDACMGKVLLNVSCDAPLLSVTMDIIESRLFMGTATGKIMQVNLHDPPRTIERLVSSSEDNNESTVFTAHEGGVVTLSVSTDCRTLLSGGTDGLVHIWNIPAREIIKTIKHKGPIVSAFFTKYLYNFRTSNLEPSIIVRPLQRSIDDSSDAAILHTVCRDDNISKLLDPNVYFEKNIIVSSSSADSEKLNAAFEEIERLKSVNAALYEYSVKHIFSQADLENNEN